jgi:predicted transcriptional regulator
MDQPSRPEPANEGPDAVSSEQREARYAELRAAVQRGLDDIRAGRVADPDEALDGIEEMLDEMEAAKRG